MAAMLRKRHLGIKSFLKISDDEVFDRPLAR